MSDPAPTPAPLPAPSLTPAYVLAAITAAVGVALSQALITQRVAAIVTGFAAVLVPLVIVGIHAIVQASAHSAHVGAQGARDAASLSTFNSLPAEATVNVAPECVLRIEASSDQVRRDLVEILAAVRPPESPDAPLRNAVATGVPFASSGNAAVTWNTGAPTAQAASS